ncbi:MAG: EAL domain-containing protein [Rhodoferax sp.]|uniref:sensor domain-containing protein n=1 Tax=Rhodoferax sp. TaxID=50421 RepID=UPI00181A6B12|nr:EAL domain-containing protein [Rhodoferax sp.]NMM14132.1 EAL domain-containing protein [Rhodoferax sp.]
MTSPSDHSSHLAPPANPSALYPSGHELDVSKNPWKLALESAGQGVWDWNVVTGEQTHPVLWKEMLGYAADEIDQGYNEFVTRVHPDDIARVQDAFTACLEGRSKGYAIDLRMRCKDGSWKWIMSHGMVVSHDAQGNSLRMIGTHTDITERKQAEQALLELNAQLIEETRLLETTLASISQGIFMIEANGRVSTFNPKASELLGLPEQFLATHPTVQEIALYQCQRGDFGPAACLVDPHARRYLTDGCSGAIPNHYLRTTLAGRTLEVKTQMLPSGGMVRTFADVSDYVQAEEARKRLNQLLDATQAIARVGGWDADIANDTVFWTEGIYRILDTSIQEFTPTPATANQFFTPAAKALIKASYSDGTDQPQLHDLELEMITAKGRHIWVHSMGTTTWKQGQPVKRTAVLQDITERKQGEAALRENEQIWKLALESTGDGVWDWDIPSGEKFFSKRLLEMYGFGEAERSNPTDELDSRIHPEDRAQMHRDRQAHFDGLTPTYSNERRVRCKDGSWKWVLARGMVISRDAEGKPLRMTGTHTDITERKKSEALIWQQAHFDALTGLPNRSMLRDRLEQEIKKSNRDGQQLALLFIDLDHFKEVNDTLGHDSGDLLLIEAARRIRGAVRASDTVARMGGDEFTVILSDLTEASSLERILQKLLQALESVFQLGDEQVFVSASIGITMYPLDATEIEDLFKHADQALYVAKGAGRNRFSFFTPALQEAAQTRVRLANDLRTGLAGQQFRVVYQPIVEMATGAVHKAEALIRWHHPTRGLISPAAFIPIAEASGLIVEIGDWVFQQAATQVQAWRASLSPQFQISVNKSPVQFHHSGSAHKPWFQQLQAMGLPGESIVVEITEGLLLDSSDSVADQLLALRDAGIQVSLDDFGTGYSSLSYLQKFDIDFIKIDQSFVRHLVPACTDLALCKAIIVMAHELGIKVIAEGVETELQRDLLAAAGCDYAQGYLFARPMSAPDFEAFMAQR